MNKKAMMHVQRALQLSANESQRSFGTGPGRLDDRLFSWWYRKTKIARAVHLDLTDIRSLNSSLKECLVPFRILEGMPSEKYPNQNLCNKEEDFDQYSNLYQRLTQLNQLLPGC